MATAKAEARRPPMKAPARAALAVLLISPRRHERKAVTSPK
jgi:hypothetical protein